MRTMLLVVLLLAWGHPESVTAQTATYRALAYDTVLAAASRHGEVTTRLSYREVVTRNHHEQTDVVFVYNRYDDFYTRRFVVRGAAADSVVAYPEQKITSRKARNTCATYFTKVQRYQKMPRYEYLGTTAGPLPNAPPYPRWTIRVVVTKPSKIPFVAQFHHMEARGYAAEEAALVRKMNRDFTVLQQVLRAYAPELTALNSSE